MKTDYRKLAKRFDAEPPEDGQVSLYNISPTQAVPVILNTNPRRIELARWGVVPGWDKTGKKTIINARKGGLVKPTFSKSFNERRCLVLADAFYEWLSVPGQRAKRPFRFLLKSEGPFAFAGMWQESEAGEKPRCVIITTEPNRTAGMVHDRMPAMLLPEAESEWLDLDTTPEQALGLLRPYPDGLMKAYEISTLVNTPGRETPDIIRPVAAGKGGASSFSRSSPRSARRTR
jgi:putative SOS response-associated peptidase YedK